MFNGVSHVSVCRRYRDVSILSWRWVKMASYTSHIPTVNFKIDLWSREKNQRSNFTSPCRMSFMLSLIQTSVIIVSLKPFEALVLLWLLFLLKRVCFVLTVHLVFVCLLLQYCNGGDLAEYLHCKYTSLISTCHLYFTIIYATDCYKLGICYYRLVNW